MTAYQHRRHNKNLLRVHLIFVTKYRKKLFYGAFRNDTKQLLPQYNPTDSVTGIVRTLKQYSTYLAWKNHHSLLKQHYWRECTLWSDGYFVASIGQVAQATIEHYIEN